MSVVIEDGTVVFAANSYVSETDLVSYAAARGKTLVTDSTQLLIEAMDYIEGLFYVGTKFRRDQPLQWPRVNVYIDDWYQNVFTIPKELKKAQMEVAIAIDEGNSPLSLIERDIQKESIAGVISVEYTLGTSSKPIVRTVNNALKKLLVSGLGGFKVDRV